MKWPTAPNADDRLPIRNDFRPSPGKLARPYTIVGFHFQPWLDFQIAVSDPGSNNSLSRIPGIDQIKRLILL